MQKELTFIYLCDSVDSRKVNRIISVIELLNGESLDKAT
jgi:hypothetical protein